MRTATQIPSADVSRSPGCAAPWSRWAKTLAWIIITIGLTLRCVRYAQDRALWFDEILLTRNVLELSPRQLLGQLLYAQGAPPAFMLLQKSAVNLLRGLPIEYAVRLVPLLAGLASVPMFYAVIRRCATAPAALIGLALFAVAEPLVYYSSEAKQYGVDVAVALAVMLTTFRAREKPSPTRWIVLGTVGAAGLLLSHAAAFVVAGAMLMLLCEKRAAENFKARWIVAGICAATFAINYVFFLRGLTNSAYLLRYWDAQFMPRSIAAAPWLGNSIARLFTDESTLWLSHFAAVAMALAAVGVIHLARQNRPALALLTAPILLTILAAALRRYPFGGRLTLFLVPALIVLIAAGIDAFVQLAGRHSRWLRYGVVLLAAGIVAVPSVGRAGIWLAHPLNREETRDMLITLRDEARPGDGIYVFHDAQTSFDFYAPRVGLSGHRVYLGQNGEHWGTVDLAVYVADAQSLRGRGRVWIFFCHIDREPQVERWLLGEANKYGHCLDTYHARGVDLYLYDFPG